MTELGLISQKGVMTKHKLLLFFSLDLYMFWTIETVIRVRWLSKVSELS